MSPGSAERSWGERVAAVVLTPLVAAWDLFRSGVFGLFSVLERLDPIAAGAVILRRVAPSLRRLWQAILPALVAVREFFRTVKQAVANFFYPLTKPIARVLGAIANVMLRPIRAAAAALGRVVRKLRAGLAPIVETSSRWWRVMTGPIRRLNARVRQRCRSVAEASRLAVRRVLRRGPVDGDYSTTDNPTTEASTGASS